MFEPIILGTIQGIFEWLPISSQGNLILVMVGIFGIGIIAALKYSIFLHFGTSGRLPHRPCLTLL